MKKLKNLCSAQESVTGSLILFITRAVSNTNGLGDHYQWQRPINGYGQQLRTISKLAKTEKTASFFHVYNGPKVLEETIHTKREVSKFYVRIRGMIVHICRATPNILW